MKKNIIAKHTNMKTYFKYLCAVLLVIGTSARAWATTETIAFNTSDCVWGFNQGGQAYSSGTYNAYGYTIYGDHVKYNYYKDKSYPYDEHWQGVQIEYNNNGEHVADGYIILPNFGGTISSISVYTYSGAGTKKTQYLTLYVGGVSQGEKTLLGGDDATTPATWSGLSISAGTEVKIMNTSTLNGHTGQEVHIERIVVTHSGAAIGSATPSDGKPTLSAIVSPVGAGTITLSNSRPANGATINISAAANSGYTFVGWSAETKYSCDGDYSDNSTILGDEWTATTTLTMPNYNTVLTAVFDETTCTIDTKVVFANSGTQNVNASTSAQTFDNDGTAKRVSNNANTGQTVTYSSSNPSVTVNTSGRVSIPANFIGSVTITATAAESGDYCESSESYTLNVNGYTVTYHYPSTCSASTPANVGAPGVIGSHSLPTNMGVDGYQFIGWTTNSSFADGNSAPDPLYTTSVTVTSNINLYAAYKKVGSKFLKMAANTALTGGDYVICTNFTGAATVMTNTLDANKRMTTNSSDYTFDGDGNLSCNDEDCIWTISGSAGNWVLYNSSAKKYLSANNGSTGSSDRQMRLADASSTDYEKWIIAQKDASTVPYQVRNKGRVGGNASDNGLNVSSGKIGYFANTGSLYFFKRTSTSNAYTINPDCDAAEYTVTFNLGSAPTGATVTASATGATFSSPVLAPVTSGTAVTIGATAPTGYHFDHWTVTSGGASLSSAATNASNGFTMPASNVVLTPVFAANSYTITYLDKGGSAFSGTHVDSPTTHPTTHTYGTATALNGATKDSWEFAGWYTTSTCTSGTQVTTLGATDYTANITLYALWVHFTDPLAWCPEPEISIDGTTYITSMYHESNGGMIRGSAQITVSGRNMGITESVTLTSDNSAVYFSLLNTNNIKEAAANQPKTSITLTTDANGKINGDAGQTVYVHFMPASLGDGSVTDVTITATYAVPDPDVVRTGHVYVRSMPAQFAVATKVGNTWYALPANMSGAGNPEPIQIDVNETNWTAKGPSTVAYAMWPVKTVNGGGSYTANGDHWRLVGNSNKALWASTSASGYTINNNAAVTAVGDNVTTSYEWQITTTPPDLENPTTGPWKYYIQSHQTNNTRYLNIKSSDVVWGVYNEGVQLTKDMYLLPLTIVPVASASVMEWGESEIALKCAASTTLTSVTIDGSAVTPTPSLTSLGGDIYKITGEGMPNLSTLATYAMKTMVINLSEGGTPKQLILTIPFILTSTNSPALTPKTAVNLRSLAAGGSQDARNDVISSVDVVVRNGAQLDVTNDESTYCTFKDLYIYPGGKVHINTLNLGADNVYLRGGFSWLEAVKDYRLPQMLVESGKTISGIGSSGHGIYYDLYLDNSRYYMMCVPKDVTLASITNEEGGDDGKVWIKEYNGENRTKTPKEKGWVNITTASLLRGVGYEMAIKPRVTGRTIGIMRMPLLSATAWSDETACTPSVTAWGVGNANVTANNQGWNFIGSPFFSSFRNTDANGQFGTNMEIRFMVHHEVNGQWDGTWDWSDDAEAVKYITIPQKMYDDYTDVRAKNYEIEAFYPFFIQAATTGTLSFTNGSKILKAPSLLRTAVPTREVDIDFILSDANGTSDQAGLTIGNDYSADFDMDDKEKTIVNENYLKVYTIVGEYRTAYNSLPEAIAELPIPVGYIAPIAGQYTFSLVEGDYSSVEHVWLTDYEMNRTVDLLDGSYEFTTEKGMNNTRFALNVILKPETENTGTGVDAINADDGQPIKFIYEDKMYIKQNGVIYDATGKRVREINK